MGETGQKPVFYLEGEEMGPERARALLTATQPIASKSKFGISQRLGVLSLAQPVNSPPAIREDSLEAISTLHTPPQFPDLLMGLTRTGQ